MGFLKRKELGEISSAIRMLEDESLTEKEVGFIQTLIIKNVENAGKNKKTLPVIVEAHQKYYDALLAILNEYDASVNRGLLSGMQGMPERRRLAKQLRIIYDYQVEIHKITKEFYDRFAEAVK